MRRAVFLDRDGTLIEDFGYLSDPEGVREVRGAREGLDALREAGWAIVVVTNQSGVARGLFREQDFRAVMDATSRLLGPFDGVYACFHLPEGRVAPWNVECDCRKPAPGMILRAAEELGIDLAASVGVGDSIRDLEAYRAAGVRPILVRTGNGRETAPLLAWQGFGDVEVVDDLREVAATLLAPPEAAGGLLADEEISREVPERARIVLDREELARRMELERAVGRTIVLANGCFDLLHVGHLRYLEGAKREGDVLVVALNSDASVRRNKGADRPYQPQEERAEILAAFRCVDYVTVFNEPTADELLRALRPDVHAKGTDWRAEDVPEAGTAREIGARVAIVGDAKTHSSTSLARRVDGA